MYLIGLWNLIYDEFLALWDEIILFLPGPLVPPKAVSAPEEVPLAGGSHLSKGPLSVVTLYLVGSFQSRISGTNPNCSP